MGCNISRDGGVPAKDTPLSQEEATRQMFHTLLFMFDDIDQDKNGSLDRKEIEDKMHKDEDLQKLIKIAGGIDTFAFMQMDLDGDGKISKAEWGHIVRKGYLMQLFQEIDTDRSGYIDRKELTAKLEMDNAVQTLMKDFGLNPDFFVFEQFDKGDDEKDSANDGKISKNEWLKVLLKKEQPAEEHENVKAAEPLPVPAPEKKEPEKEEPKKEEPEKEEPEKEEPAKEENDDQ